MSILGPEHGGAENGRKKGRCRKYSLRKGLSRNRALKMAVPKRAQEMAVPEMGSGKGGVENGLRKR